MELESCSPNPSLRRWPTSPRTRENATLRKLASTAYSSAFWRDSPARGRGLFRSGRRERVAMCASSLRGQARTIKLHAVTLRGGGRHGLAGYEDAGVHSVDALKHP